MNYFKIFSIVWGIAIIGVRGLIHLIPERWTNFELNTAYTDERPSWIWIVTIVALTLIGFTWYKELTTDISYSLILTIVLSLTLVKLGQLIFNYAKFRQFVHRALVEDRSLIVKINIATTILGAIFIALGIFVY